MWGSNVVPLSCTHQELEHTEQKQVNINIKDFVQLCHLTSWLRTFCRHFIFSFMYHFGHETSVLSFKIKVGKCVCSLLRRFQALWRHHYMKLGRSNFVHTREELGWNLKKTVRKVLPLINSWPCRPSVITSFVIRQVSHDKNVQLKTQIIHVFWHIRWKRTVQTCISTNGNEKSYDECL